MKQNKYYDVWKLFWVQLLLKQHRRGTGKEKGTQEFPANTAAGSLSVCSIKLSHVFTCNKTVRVLLSPSNSIRLGKL